MSLILSIFTLSLIFIKYWKKPSKLKNSLINASLSFFTVAFVLLFLEIGAYLFIVRSDSFSFTLANKRWFNTYWQPINTLGYRDDNYSLEQLKNNKVVFVVGDSFIAGQGIKDYKNRISNLLEEKLGKGWLVANIAQVGWSTPDEYQGIIKYPYKPNIIVLSYFIDDIRQASSQLNEDSQFRWQQLLQPVPSYLQGIVNQSYLANYFYWQWYRSHNNQPESIYWEKMQGYYTNPVTWGIHQQELKSIIDYAKAHQITLIPILFPNLVSLEKSKPILDKVAVFFQEQGTTPINLTTLFAGKTPAELVVNQVDAHPNEWVNQQVSEIVFKVIKAQ
ncbi:hypothetical protein BegalDRAFT_2239 [Beggiatoa alba B18LD]|uniref:SGNH hydrolase-type esterase domain-containing protein n=1 Tax=Beggiatoa alba B18LD TaxID=395493 RepID=I3CHK1_9GAMM|nr:hypothetical protein BegalDRAFT_2239 [Beggiatoa alba B18LD]